VTDYHINGPEIKMDDCRLIGKQQNKKQTIQEIRAKIFNSLQSYVRAI